jgi:hypothetical protein
MPVDLRWGVGCIKDSRSPCLGRILVLGVGRDGHGAGTRAAVHDGRLYGAIVAVHVAARLLAGGGRILGLFLWWMCW